MITGMQRLLCNAFNFDFCVLGAMTCFLTEPFPSFHFESDYFFAFYLAENLSLYYRFQRSTRIHSAIIICQQYISELNFISVCTIHAGYKQSLTILYFK